MALFGSTSRRFQLGNFDPRTPPIHNPNQGQIEAGALDVDMPPMQAAAVPKRHWGDKLAELGEVIMSTQGNAAGIEALQMRDMAARARQAQQLAERTYQRRRADENADWMARQRYKLENPEPENKTALQQNYEYLKTIDPKLAETFILNQSNPMQAIPGFDEAGNKTLQFIRPGTMGGAPAVGPQPGTVRNGWTFKGGNPNDRSNWVQGGAPSQGGASFP